YVTGKQVNEHIQAGTIVGFGTGTPGDFLLRVGHGYPTEEEFARYEFKLVLGIHVRDGLVCFRDLYDLMRWTADCPEDQKWQLENGLYHITLCTKLPASGIRGDNQEILVWFSRLTEFPVLPNLGVPTLCE